MLLGPIELERYLLSHRTHRHFDPRTLGIPTVFKRIGRETVRSATEGASQSAPLGPPSSRCTSSDEEFALTLSRLRTRWELPLRPSPRRRTDPARRRLCCRPAGDEIYPAEDACRRGASYGTAFGSAVRRMSTAQSLSTSEGGSPKSRTPPASMLVISPLSRSPPARGLNHSTR